MIEVHTLRVLVEVTVSSMVDSKVHNKHHIETEHKQHQRPHQNLSTCGGVRGGGCGVWWCEGDVVCGGVRGRMWCVVV